MAIPVQKTYDIYATLPTQIAVRIGQAIVENEFTPGQKLREVDLASAFGVSRASVREALRIVEREGLVTILPQRGAQVTALSADEVQDIFDIRAQLMGLACERLVAALPASGRSELERLYGDLERSFDDAEAYARTSLAISEFCVRNAGSRRLADLVLSFGRQTARYTKLSLSTVGRRQQSMANWRGLVQSILSGDAKAAESSARQLVFDTRDTALRMLADDATASAL